jgi:hypothetical protein
MSWLREPRARCGFCVVALFLVVRALVAWESVLQV